MDNYCERLAPEFWAEPINAVTNFAFIIASILFLIGWRTSRTKSRTALFLGLWIGVIGIGSFLFHTFATLWALAADSIPILVFILVYLFLAVRNYLKVPLWGSIVITVAYIPFTYLLVPLIQPVIGSSSGYVPALLAIFAVGVMMHGRDETVSKGLIVTGCIFLLSIGFRMADMAYCDTFPLGTHFMWHVLNAVVLYRLADIYLKHVDRAEA